MSSVESAFHSRVEPSLTNASNTGAPAGVLSHQVVVSESGVSAGTSAIGRRLLQAQHDLEVPINDEQLWFGKTRLPHQPDDLRNTHAHVLAALPSGQE